MMAAMTACRLFAISFLLALPAAVQADEGALRFCPLTVKGAKTVLADVEGGIEAAITAPSAEGEAEIRARAKYLAQLTTSEKSKGGGHGNGSGGGRMRNCPIVTKDTTIREIDIPGGSRITMLPKQASELETLRREARARYTALPNQNTKVIAESGRDAQETRLFSSASGDLRGDGKMLLAVGGYSGSKERRIAEISVYSRMNDATWKLEARAERKSASSSSIRNVEIADLDNDGKAEVIALGWIGESTKSADAELSIYTLGKDGLSEKATIHWKSGSNANGYGLAIGDVDGDRRPEIISGGFGIYGKGEEAELRVWRYQQSKLVLAAETHFGSAGYASARINAIAAADLDGDGRAEIVTGGRNGELKNPTGAAPTKERGEVTAWKFERDRLVLLAREPWLQGSKTRIRTVRIADVDGDAKPEIVAGGQCESEGRACLLVLRMVKGALKRVASRVTAAEDGRGEVKDLIVVRNAAGPHIVTTGPKNAKPDRIGHLQLFRMKQGQLELEEGAVSIQGDETRARSIFTWKNSDSLGIYTVGHTLAGKQMLGQLLDWQPLLQLKN